MLCRTTVQFCLCSFLRYMQEGFFLESIEGTASLESYENNVLKGTISAAHRDAGVSATIKFSIDLSN